jgi:septum formation protein
MPLILASGSNVRADLLRAAGLRFEVVVSSLDERAVEARFESGLSPAEAARALAREKALAVSHLRPEAGVIGADQTLALGSQRFTKARTMAQARATLRRLRGRTHALHSAFALAQGGCVVADGASTARLTMRDMTDSALDAYLERAGEGVLGSVGCYHLEGLGVTLFTAVEGDYFTVLGLPLLDLLGSLRATGLMTD